MFNDKQSENHVKEEKLTPLEQTFYENCAKNSREYGRPALPRLL
jgi:hypothetical protein